MELKPEKESKKVTRKQNVGMIFEQSGEDKPKPIAIYWKNGSVKVFLLKEVNEFEMDKLMGADLLPETKKEN